MFTRFRVVIVRLCAGGAALLGLLVLAGWTFAWVALTAVVAGFIAMNPATAVGLLVGGAALGLHDARQPGLRRLTLVCAAVTALIGLTRLIQVTTGAGVDVDLLLFREAVEAAVPANRMALGTAVGLLGIGLALGVLKRSARGAQVLAAGVGLIALVTACSYLYGGFTDAPDLRAQPMALNTVVGLSLLAVGVLAASPDAGVMRLLRSDSPGGVLARRLLPAAVILPVAVGALRLLGERHGLYDASFGVSLMAVTTIALLVGLILSTAYALDRTDAARSHATLQLRAHAEEIADLYNNSPCGYHSLDEHGVFRRINDTELRWLGYARDEVVGRLSFRDILTPESVERFTQQFPRFKSEGRVDDCEFELVRKDGSTFHVSLSATAILDGDGRYQASRSTVFDITERKLADAQIRQMNAQLGQRIRELAVLNGELEAFSYSVSHDLRAPLRHVAGFAALLENHASAQLDARGRRYVDTIITATGAMGRLIDDLLGFSRMGRAEVRRSTVDLGQLADEVRLSLQPDVTGRDVEWRIDALPCVQADEAMLRAVLVNLLSNAVKYTRPRSPAVIHVGALQENGADEHHVFVRDNGVGFDMQYVDRLFGVFQRLHHADEFEGTGIGLAIVRRVIARHGGRTWAEGALGAGATIHFTLPGGARQDVDAQTDSTRRG